MITIFQAYCSKKTNCFVQVALGKTNIFEKQHDGMSTKTQRNLSGTSDPVFNNELCKGDFHEKLIIKKNRSNKIINEFTTAMHYDRIS